MPPRLASTLNIRLSMARAPGAGPAGGPRRRCRGPRRHRRRHRPAAASPAWTGRAVSRQMARAIFQPSRSRMTAWSPARKNCCSGPWSHTLKPVSSPPLGCRASEASRGVPSASRNGAPTTAVIPVRRQISRRPSSRGSAAVTHRSGSASPVEVVAGQGQLGEHHQPGAVVIRVFDEPDVFGDIGGECRRRGPCTGWRRASARWSPCHPRHRRRGRGRRLPVRCGAVAAHRGITPAGRQ